MANSLHKLQVFLKQTKVQISLTNIYCSQDVLFKNPFLKLVC